MRYVLYEVDNHHAKALHSTVDHFVQYVHSYKRSYILFSCKRIRFRKALTLEHEQTWFKLCKFDFPRKNFITLSLSYYSTLPSIYVTKSDNLEFVVIEKLTFYENLPCMVKSKKKKKK